MLIQGHPSPENLSSQVDSEAILAHAVPFNQWHVDHVFVKSLYYLGKLVYTK